MTKAGGFRMRVDRRVKAIEAVREAVADAMQDELDFLLEEANRTVPIEEATLARSGKVTLDRRRLRGAISYDTPYAARQHEDTRLRHDSGRRAKWLELTIRENQHDTGQRLADAIRKAIGD